MEQQSKIDNLRYQLLEQTAEIKKKVEKIAELTADVAKMKKTQQLSRQTILGLEQKIEQNAILTNAYFEQVTTLFHCHSYTLLTTSMDNFEDKAPQSACERD